jgi:hypothetical protein
MTPLAALSVLLLGLASCEGGLDSSEPFAAGDSEPLTGGGSCEDDLSGRTVGLLACDPRTEGGYTLFAPLGGHGVYLIDQGGNEVHRWNSWTTPGASIYLLPNGHLLRTGSMPPTDGTMQYPAGQGGVVEEVTWEGQTVWSFRYSSDRVYQHHDVEPLPDGNVLILAWEVRSAAQAEARGRRPELMSADELWPDHVVEYDPQQDAIVWSWHLWDHLIQNVDPDLPDYGDPADHPERLDINAIGDGPAPQGVDWNHTNAVDYNPELDQIVLSAHAQNELWVIDHSTTEEEAASHTGGRSGRGGDLLYRWGNPKHYGRGGNGDRQLQGQHDVQWIEDGLPGAGDLLIFDNNAGEDWSAIKQITPPVPRVAQLDLRGGRSDRLLLLLHLRSAAPPRRQHLHLRGGVGPLLRGHARRRHRLGVREPRLRRHDHPPGPASADHPAGPPQRGVPGDAHPRRPPRAAGEGPHPEGGDRGVGPAPLDIALPRPHHSPSCSKTTS